MLLNIRPKHAIDGMNETQHPVKLSRGPIFSDRF
ncbi:protein of unknown function [Cupriavidus neocaledonicus]|uniref:Uncharacterized protein n=1 Tax=Cupriavidus neocaledonicus TaxID=1040979 RepID=A0A375HDG8_9BURK|nr:protein of unknown function [Cupriavidus neocaledonicus]